MRKRVNGQADDLFGESDSVSVHNSLSWRANREQDEESSDTETVKTDKDRNKDKDKNNDKARDRDKDKNNLDSHSAERLSRPQTQGTSSRGVSSPTGRRTTPGPLQGKASTAPPGSGSALLAHRAASRGPSPLRSRQSSPLSSRAISPDIGRAASPVNSVRGASPSGAARGTTPRPTREDSPVTSIPAAPAPSHSKVGKRKTTSGSPSKDGASNNTSQKRKTSPGTPALDRDRKKKKSASTTPTPTPTEPDIVPFPGMITQTDVLEWFRRQRGEGTSVPMNSAILHFRDRITSAGSRRDDNQKLFLHWVGALTVNESGKRLRLKDGL